MAASCVRWVLSRTVGAVCGASPGYWTAPSTFTLCSARSSIRWSPFCTAVADTEQKKKKNPNPQAHDTISNVGRKISHRIIKLISDTGENMGTMDRERVLSIMDEKGLKLVLRNERSDPPVYQLMSSKQIHNEKLKLKPKPAVVQVKELTFSSGIGTHDLTTKLKQVESWLEKKHHVRITVRTGRRQPAGDLVLTLEQMVQQIGMMVGFVSVPKVIQDGQAALCILRPASAKELSKKKANTSGSESSQSKAVAAQTRQKGQDSSDLGGRTVTITKKQMPGLESEAKQEVLKSPAP